MRKTVVLSLVLLLAGCACHKGDCQKTAETEEAKVVTQEVATPVAIPCSYSCAQSGKCQTLEPVVLKPRVTEIRGDKRKRPCCDEDVSLLQGEDAETYVPDAPEIYVISANRTVNSMQAEAAPLFKQVGHIKLYIEKATPKSEDLPGGMDKGTDVIKKRFSQMKNVDLVESKHDADFLIGNSADWYDTPTKKVPAIKYDISLKDRGGNLVGEWSEIIHQAEGDRSWW